MLTVHNAIASSEDSKARVGKQLVAGLLPCRSPDDIPKQLNGCDCGVFALMFAEYQSRDAPFTFDQRHMEYFRVKVLADIMSQTIDIPKTVPKL